MRIQGASNGAVGHLLKKKGQWQHCSFTASAFRGEARHRNRVNPIPQKITKKTAQQ